MVVWRGKLVQLERSELVDLGAEEYTIKSIDKGRNPRCRILCPFCKTVGTHSYTSLKGKGQYCDCGAKHTKHGVTVPNGTSDYVTPTHGECAQCNEVKVIEHFRKVEKSPVGVARICNDCHRNKNRGYYNTPEGKRKKRLYHIENRDKRKRYMRRFAEKNGYAKRGYEPDKSPARVAVYRAIKKGILIRPDECSKCGKECKPDAHHHNGYDKENRLNVVWLCRACHALEENPEFNKLLRSSECTRI